MRMTSHISTMAITLALSFLAFASTASISRASTFEDADIVYKGPDRAKFNERVRDFDLKPIHRVSYGGADFEFSDFFRVTQPVTRAFILAIVKKSDQRRLVVFYRARGLGIYRLLPAINRFRNYQLDKGLSEELLGVPHVVQRFLEGIEAGQALIKVIPHELLDLAVRTNHTSAEYKAYKNSEDFAGHEVKWPNLFSYPRKAWLECDNPSWVVRHPKDYLMEDDGYASDFSRPTATYQVSSEMNGFVTVRYYLSKSGHALYRMNEDTLGRVWFARVERAESEVNGMGLPLRHFDPKSLTMPMFEYKMQIPRAIPGIGYPIQGPDSAIDSRLADAWNYIREVSLIQDWYAAQGRPIPAPNLPR